LRALQGQVAQRGLSMEVSDDALRELARRGYDPVYGARPLRRLIQHSIEGELARAILAGDARDGDTVRVQLRGREFVVEVEHRGAPVRA
jgi:ATP-dependent Clp protease ATP-binding subunit ClpB